MSESGSAIVVGVGPGLGLSLVKRFAAAGHKVAMAARDPANLDALTAEAGLGDAAKTIACDTTQPADVARLFEETEAALGAPEVVIYNAGTYRPGGIMEISPEDFETCWRVGCFGGFLVGQAAAKAMVPHGRGSILFTGATAALRGSARFMNLASPKFALRAVAQSMARELGPQGIHVAHVIVDGQINAPRHADAAATRGPDSFLEPDAIAETYYQLHTQPRSAWTQELDLRPWVEKF